MAIVVSEGVNAGEVKVQVAAAPSGLVTVQPIVPPGLVPPDGPVTIDVIVAKEPSVGVDESAMLMVGVTKEIPKETEFEVAVK